MKYLFRNDLNFFGQRFASKIDYYDTLLSKGFFNCINQKINDMN